ncbi:multicopper oxidase family protein [Prauserella muralis]|uniref:Copper oxidase n=1 Tax=Prauserella muralis TaxID=588067 RepID=A0A2V4B1V2_9PSEU|nr:multicopper oxidase family protein [Prauserella muralis]PXY28260.1 copper oxidase [Prauserella muralis]TWE27429.1 FtsP/CotA-like multicopper oxidase with cupredoxin domain [Prauserella muralis]
MNPLDRRTVLRAGLAATGLGVLAACTSSTDSAPGRLIGPTAPRVQAVERGRQTTGQTRTHPLTAQVSQVDLGGVQANTWTYDGTLPGREIRVRTGDLVEVPLTNRLPTETTIHWHGLPLRNDMDGVPDLTQAPIAAGDTFTYRFVADTPGTFWFHPHTGVHLDRGLYAPLIVEDPAEPGGYDQDWTVVLDDWIDGTGTTPDEVFATLRQGMGGMGSMPGMGSGGPMLMGATSPLLGDDAGDIAYPYYLINGRLPAAPATFTARPGQRARIRFINAGGDTAFRVALGGHRMSVIHTDGFPVQPVSTDALLIGMGERYDVLVTLNDGVFPLVALAEGKNATARALVRTGAGRAPAPGARPVELDCALVGYPALRPTANVALPAKPVDVEHRLELTGNMMSYKWGINGRQLDLDTRPRVREGQRVRVTLANTTMMWHPMHLHGHTFQINGTGPRKDTVIVLPRKTVTCDFDADNPGQWMVHCHNIYHAEAGMAAILGYESQQS